MASHMAWELTLVHPHGHRLGSPNEVKTAIAKAWPDLDWMEFPSLMEQIQDQPEHPAHAEMASWSAEQRRRAALPTTVGVLETGTISLEVSGIDDDPVHELYVDVRGDGDPTAILLRIKSEIRWSIKELLTDRFLDERTIRERWDNFRRLTGRSL